MFAEKRASSLLFGIVDFCACISSLVLFHARPTRQLPDIQNLVFHMRLNILQQMNRLSPLSRDNCNWRALYRIEQDVEQVAEVGSNLVPYVLQRVQLPFCPGTMSR